MPRDDLETLARILEDVEQRLEDGTIAIRYLENVVNHPDEPKFRKINKANRRFSSEVWLQPGIRTAFLAIGFREDREASAKEDGTAVLLLDPLTDHGRRCAEFTLQRLKNIRARRRGGGGVAGAAVAASVASHPDAGTEPRPRECECNSMVRLPSATGWAWAYKLTPPVGKGRTDCDRVTSPRARTPIVSPIIRPTGEQVRNDDLRGLRQEPTAGGHALQQTGRPVPFAEAELCRHLQGVQRVLHLWRLLQQAILPARAGSSARAVRQGGTVGGTVSVA
ncbi:unnamed protein product [Ectocarpus sp. 12 AP-2014]